MSAMTHTFRHEVVDLFAGPGGWSVACRRLGLREMGVETDRAAHMTRRANGFHTIRASVADLGPENFPSAVGLIASPPCQTFSMAGKGAGRKVDPVYLASFGPDAEEGVLAALCRAFQRTVREALSTYALDDEPHAVDLVTVRRPEEDRGPGAFSIVASWRPLVQEAELVGGELDGDVIALANPLDLHQLRLPEPPSHAYGRLIQDYDAGVYPERFTVQTYVLSGWNNAERRWRYSLEETR